MILYGQLAEDTARWRASGGDRALLYRDVQLAAAAQAARVWAGTRAGTPRWAPARRSSCGPAAGPRLAAGGAGRPWPGS